MTFIVIVAFICGSVYNLLFIEGKYRVQKIKKLHDIGYKISTYFLLAYLGFKGGAEIWHPEDLETVLWSSGAAIFLSIATFFVSKVFLDGFGDLDDEARLSWSAHQGSVSVGTFAVAFLYFANQYEIGSYVSVWVVLMEVPAVVLAAICLEKKRSWKQAFLNRSVQFLFAMLLLGFFVEPILQVYKPVIFSKLLAIIFSELLFEIVLGYFLFEMGRLASGYLRGEELRSLVGTIVIGGIMLPLVNGFIGVVLGAALGLPEGHVIMLSILAASASYVLVPAVMLEIVKETAVVPGLSASLMVTLPFNLIVGMRIYEQGAIFFSGELFTTLLALVLLLPTYIIVRRGLKIWLFLKTFQMINSQLRPFSHKARQILLAICYKLLPVIIGLMLLFPNCCLMPTTAHDTIHPRGHGHTPISIVGTNSLESRRKLVFS